MARKRNGPGAMPPVSDEDQRLLLALEWFVDLMGEDMTVQGVGLTGHHHDVILVPLVGRGWLTLLREEDKWTYKLTRVGLRELERHRR